LTKASKAALAENKVVLHFIRNLFICKLKTEKKVVATSIKNSIQQDIGLLKKV
jgi:hypothetical protein